MAGRSTGDFRILVGQQETGLYSGIEFGNSNQCILLSSVRGMEIPPIRNNYGDWSGRDGGYMSSQLYGGRIITISGFYWDDYATCVFTPNEAPVYSIREKMVNSLVIRKKYPIFIRFLNTKTYYTEGFLTDFQMDYDNYKVGEYQVTLFCPDYALAVADTYGDPNSIYRYAVLNKEVNGGHLVPKPVPVLFKEGKFTTQVQYFGLIPCYPKITLQGPVTNPTFINQTTNQQFKINREISENAVLVIDMDKRQVTINGKSASYFIDESSEWWCLNPGVNKIYYKSDHDTDTSSATLEYRELVQGV